MASRTDQGVSARANALAVVTGLPGPPLLRALNGLSPEIFFTAAALVPREFRVRDAARRVYRYFEPSTTADLERWREAAELFAGPVDVRSFGRGLPPAVPARRVVESVRVTAGDPGLLVEVRAPSFVWGMVRKIVGALREVDAARLSLARLRAAIAGRERLTLPAAEPEPLLLWEVEYPLPWEYRWTGPNRHQRRAREDARKSTMARLSLLRALADETA